VKLSGNCDPQVFFRIRLPDRLAKDPRPSWECLGQWSLAAVTKSSPIVVAVCPALPRDQAADLLHQLAAGLTAGQFDAFAVCNACVPKGRGHASPLRD
jgi:hypothetical protein